MGQPNLSEIFKPPSRMATNWEEEIIACKERLGKDNKPKSPKAFGK